MGEPDELQARAIGRYLLYGEIAAGGMATVHFGRLRGPAGFSRTVAIKRLHAHLAKEPEFVAAFLDEARLAARVRHPNVVSTLDVVAISGELFLVMEYVQGETLSRLLRATRARGEHIDPRVVATVLSGALHGLHAAHEARDERGDSLGIVHRDVSPQNILVGTDGVTRVLDFGVAKAVGRLQTTRAGEVKGKLAYMPPERFLGSLLTPQADVYAAAVVMWETLTGKRLFPRDEDNDAALINAVLHAEVMPPSQIASHVPPALDVVTMKGLARDLNERYGTALEMALDLEARIGIVSTFEVGQWVQKVAAPALERRAERVKVIETMSERAIATDELLRSVEAESAFRSPSASGPVSTLTIPDEPMPSRVRAKAWSAIRLGAVGALGLLLYGIVAFAQSHKLAATPAADVSADGASAPVAPVAAPPPLASAGDVASTNAAPDALSAPSPTASTTPASRPHTKSPIVRAAPRKPVVSAPAPSVNCVATFDDNGRKHWRCP